MEPDTAEAAIRTHAYWPAFGRSVVVPVIFPVTAILLWQLAVQYNVIDRHFFPAPSEMAAVLWVDVVSGRLLNDSLASLQRVGGGLLIGVLSGIVLGLAMGAWRPVDAALNTSVQVLRAIPPITWIGFSILWFGLGSRPAIFLIALGVVFPMLMNTYAGVRQLDRIYMRAARNLGARGWMLFRNVVLPGSLPSIATGLRVSVGLAWVMVVVGELVGAPSGLGATLMRAQDYGQTDRMLAYMVVIGLYGLLSDFLVKGVTNHLLRWQQGTRS